MGNISNRLRHERKRLNLNQDDFATLGGVKKGAQVNYENGTRSPDAEYLALVAAAGVDIQFIITGQPSAEKLPPDEVDLLLGYRGLDVRSKAGVLALIGGMKTDAPSAIFHGNVGQVVQGDQHASGPMTFTAESGNKKKP